MKLAIYGTGGFSREVAPFAQQWVRTANENSGSPDDVVFVSDLDERIGHSINGIPVLSFSEMCTPEHRSRRVVIALADWKVRREIASRCEAEGLTFGSITARTHQTYQDVTIGQGAIICENTTFTSNIRIGKHFHCNIYSYVAHDCIVGDFVTFAPKVSCNGRVVIEDNVYVGTGAVLRDGTAEKPLVIGRGAVVGMGAVVTKDVPAGAVVVGNPARRLERQK